MKENDYYKILNLNRDTTEEEIKRQYRRLALKFHPDRNPIDEEAEEKFKEINEAYAVLGDPEKRRVYDRFGYSGFRKRYNGEDISHYSSGRSCNMGDRFFFGRGMGCRRGARFWRKYSSHLDEQSNFAFDRNLVYGIEITSEEALYGTEKVIITRTRLGDKTYRFTIPAGIKNGATVKLSGGDHSSTDLYIQINVKEKL